MLLFEISIIFFELKLKKKNGSGTKIVNLLGGGDSLERFEALTIAVGPN